MSEPDIDDAADAASDLPSGRPSDAVVDAEPDAEPVVEEPVGLIDDDGVAGSTGGQRRAPRPGRSRPEPSSARGSMFTERATAADDDASEVGIDPEGELSLEAMFESTLADLERVTVERDEYLDLARRVQAEFENYKRRVTAQRTEEAGRMAEAVITELLPVLDAGEAALAHGVEDVGPIHSMLESTLTKLGLTKVDEVDAPFDPNVHEAVLSEPGDDASGPEVAEVLRTGYSWKGRVVRPAMVKVRG